MQIITGFLILVFSLATQVMLSAHMHLQKQHTKVIALYDTEIFESMFSILRTFFSCYQLQFAQIYPTHCSKLSLYFFRLISVSHSFIVPQELPSILSLVYSNVPPIKKGTDSRVGFGFRLGEHADFQVQLELGPQKFTKPIGKCVEINMRKTFTHAFQL